MHNGLNEITNINDADYIELVSGETSDFTVGQIYEVKVDDGSIYTEGSATVWIIHIPQTLRCSTTRNCN